MQILWIIFIQFQQITEVEEVSENRGAGERLHPLLVKNYFTVNSSSELRVWPNLRYN